MGDVKRRDAGETVPIQDPPVIYDQREPEPSGGPARGEAAAPWRPPDTPIATAAAEGGLVDAALRAASYVAIDRIDGDVVTLAVAPWPTVDPATGRLDFGPAEERRVVTVALPRLQARTDADRVATGQLVRPVRVSDVLLVTGLAGGIDRWGSIVDVTRAGRLAAKAALYSAVAPAPTIDEAAGLGLDPSRIAPPPAPGETPGPAGGEEPPPAGPVAYPAV
jgi:hypothetical protein